VLTPKVVSRSTTLKKAIKPIELRINCLPLKQIIQIAIKAHEPAYRLSVSLASRSCMAKKQRPVYLNSVTAKITP
jgi:hypothetical protein